MVTLHLRPGFAPVESSASETPGLGISGLARVAQLAEQLVNLEPGGGESANARGIAFPLTSGDKFLTAHEKRPLSASILLYISVLGITLPASAAAEFRSAKRSWQRIGSGI